MSAHVRTRPLPEGKERAIVRAMEGGEMTSADVARELGVSKETVRAVARARGIYTRGIGRQPNLRHEGRLGPTPGAGRLW